MVASSYARLQQTVYETICEPPPGYKVGEIVTGSIMALIACNVVVCVLETEQKIHDASPDFFYYSETISVMIFTIEYILTIWSCTVDEQYSGSYAMRRIKAMLRPMAIVDVLAIAPFYLNLILENYGNIDLRFLRTLRLVRLVRLFRNGQLSEAFRILIRVLKTRRIQLGLAMSIYMLVVLMCSSIMYIIETTEEGTKFTSIPASLWWGIVTMTTIGYGDMVPTTSLGKFFASFVGYLGIFALALPVGIIGSGFTDFTDDESSERKYSTTKTTVSLSSHEATAQDENNIDIVSQLPIDEEEQIRSLEMAVVTLKEAIRSAEESSLRKRKKKRPEEIKEQEPKANTKGHNDIESLEELH